MKMRSIKSLFLMLAAVTFISGCGSSETPDEKAPEKPKTAPASLPLAGAPTKAPTGN